MKLSIKVISVLIIILLFSIFSTRIFAQGLINNGANIVITSGSYVYINGASGNYTSQYGGIFTNDAGSTITIGGNWINNSANTGFSGPCSTVILVGTSQQIGGTNATTFHNLTGSGVGATPINFDMTISNNLDLSASTVFDINGKTLTVAGVLSGTGKFKGSSTSNLVINGSGNIANINFDQTSTASRTLKNLTINRASTTATLGNSVEVIGDVILSNGTLASSGNLKLVSNASGTARIHEITGTGAITGNVIVERYIPVSARRYRFMSSNVSSTILEDWRGEIFVTGAGTGTTLGTTNSNGFDATISNAPSVYFYDETVAGSLNYGWATPATTSASLVVGKGYRVYVRGDRSTLNRLNGTDNSQNAVTMNLIGTVNTGDITMPVTYTNNGSSTDDGWNLLGNPYPSQFDWHAFWNAGNSGYNGTNYSNINSVIYIFDVSANAYKAYNALGNTGTLTDGIIASGHAFFVKATGTSPTMTFKEQFKSSGAPLQMFKSSQADEMKINLLLDSINNDDFVLKYQALSTFQDDAYDIKKWANPSVNISSFGNDSVLHTLDSRPVVSGNDTIKLNITGSNGTFKLKMKEMPTNGKYYFLQDLYLSNTLPLFEGTTYTFNILSSIAATQGSSRFRIISSDFNSLPVSFGMFYANKIDKKTELIWTTLSENNSDYFEIQRSINNIDFSAILNVKSIGHSSVENTYKTIDENPNLFSINYYRIKQVDIGGHVEYSAIKSVQFYPNRTKIEISVFPNPAINQISLSADFKSNSCDVKIYSAEGLLVEHVASAQILNGKILLEIAKMNTGIYFIQIKEEDGNTIEAKFVKE